MTSTAPRPSRDASELLAFLEELGAGRVRHSKRTLLDHFVGVANILDRWGAEDRVWKAGLFHSIYGTEFFHDAVLPVAERPRVVARIGEEAERLAYLFCAFDRGSLYRAIDRGEPYEIELLANGARVPVSRRDIADLALVVWANALEQVPYVPAAPDAGTRSRKAIAKCAPFLTDCARDELERAYPVQTKPALRTLFNLEDPDLFLRDYWPDRPLIAHGPVARLASLVDHDFEALTKMKKTFTKAFFRTLDGKSSSLNVSSGQERDLYDAGFTIYFHSLHSPSMDAWVKALDEELGLLPGVTRVSAFASRRGLGLKPHYDMNDNFVCQARGVKRWRVAPNAHVKNPTVGYTVGAKPSAAAAAEAPNGFPTAMPEPCQTVEMRPGMTMFMPRGMWHETETLDEASLHFNIQSGIATWKDALEFLLIEGTALHLEELRAPIMQMFDGDGLRAGVADELKDKLRVLAHAIGEGDIRLDRAEFHRFVAKRRSA
jgi:hypothetical protein